MALEFAHEVTASYNVADLEAAIAWYGRVLGCTLLYKVEDIGWCEMSTHIPGVLIGLSEREDQPAGGNAINVWSVTDIVAAQDHLAQHQVRTDGDIMDVPGMVRLLTFYDPDGNAMMFAQALQPAGG